MELQISQLLGFDTSGEKCWAVRSWFIQRKNPTKLDITRQEIGKLISAVWSNTGSWLSKNSSGWKGMTKSWELTENHVVLHMFGMGKRHSQIDITSYWSVDFGFPQIINRGVDRSQNSRRKLGRSDLLRHVLYLINNVASVFISPWDHHTSF